MAYLPSTIARRREGGHSAVQICMTTRTHPSRGAFALFDCSLSIKIALPLLSAVSLAPAPAAQRPLVELQQEFLDLRFGLFLHFNIPTFSTDDWPDPQMPATAFNPTRLDCRQWAEAAKSAHMTYQTMVLKRRLSLQPGQERQDHRRSQSHPAQPGLLQFHPERGAQPGRPDRR